MVPLFGLGTTDQSLPQACGVDDRAADRAGWARTAARTLIARSPRRTRPGRCLLIRISLVWKQKPRSTGGIIQVDAGPSRAARPARSREHAESTSRKLVQGAIRP